MSFSWTPHRYSGGALALDVANSVVLRGDPARRTDRFADPAQYAAFAVAAGKYCGDMDEKIPLPAVAPENTARFLALREAIDGYFRAYVEGRADNRLLADLLESAADILRHAGPPSTLEVATAQSALRLMAECQAGRGASRMKICARCGWLFLDRSRNRSRVWCDMTVCGNRAKASRHYRKAAES